MSYWCPECREHFGKVRAGLDRLQVEYRQSGRLVRGIDYYSRTAFEFVATTLETTQSTVLGGGRYDGLAELLGGRPAPGVGFAGGDRPDDVRRPSSRREAAMDVFLVGENQVTPADLLEWANPLREAGLRVNFELDRRSVKAQFRAATRSGARYVGVVNGERVEMREGRHRRELSPGEYGTMGCDDPGRKERHVRTHTTSQISERMVGEKVTLAGWVDRRRDHGGGGVC